MQALKEDPDKMHRITFNEITKTAVKDSLKHARGLNMNLVDAQQAREECWTVWWVIPSVRFSGQK